MQLRRELLHPKPQTNLIGQDYGHWLKEKAIIIANQEQPKKKQSVFRETNKTAATNNSNPYVLIKVFIE